MARISLGALIAVLVLVGSPTQAGITSISYTPDPIVVGKSTVYTANCTPQPVKWEWDFRCTQGGTEDWRPSPPDTTSTPTKTYNESKVGSYDLRCKATYQGSGNPPPPPTTSTLIKSATVNGPDADTITAGLNTNSTGYPVMTLTVKFQVRSGTTPIGPFTDGYPEERIRCPQDDFDSGWVGGGRLVSSTSTAPPARSSTSRRSKVAPVGAISPSVRCSTTFTSRTAWSLRTALAPRSTTTLRSGTSKE